MKNYLLQQQDLSSGLQKHSLAPSQEHSGFMQIVHLHFGLSHAIN